MHGHMNVKFIKLLLGSRFVSSVAVHLVEIVRMLSELSAFLVRRQLGIICCVSAAHKRSSGFIGRYQQQNQIQPKTLSVNPHNVRTALFWDNTQRVVVISYRRFGTTYRSHPSGVKSPHRASAKPVLRPKYAGTKSLNLLCVFCEHTGVRTDCSQKCHNIKKKNGSHYEASDSLRSVVRRK
jgi:hypothetical protein